MKAVNDRIDRESEHARDLANVGAPPLAMLAAALVLALSLGFGVSLFLELRRPSIADAREAEQGSGVRVLSVSWCWRPKACSAALAQGLVVLFRATLVAVAFYPDLCLGMGLEPVGIGFHDRFCIVTNEGLVEIKINRLRPLDRSRGALDAGHFDAGTAYAAFAPNVTSAAGAPGGMQPMAVVEDVSSLMSM